VKLALDTNAYKALNEGDPRLAEDTRRAGIAIQQNDIWIAALCKQHGFALATRDRGFQRVLGLEVIEVSSPAQPSL
jgi:predicted nucleic acid-binding protein